MSILVYNRKRVGDGEKILVDYHRRDVIMDNTDPDDLAAIPDLAKKLVKSRLQIRGKLYSTIPVLLKFDVEKSIELLLRHRKDAVHVARFCGRKKLTDNDVTNAAKFLGHHAEVLVKFIDKTH